MGLLLRVWHSPVLMTWGSLIVRMLGLMLVLPLVLQRFAPGDAALWLLLGSVMALQALADMGFSQTFARAIACVEGGATLAMLRDLRTEPDPAASLEAPVTLEALLGTMRVIYRRLVLLAMVLALLALMALAAPVNASSDGVAGWSASIVVLLTSLAAVQGNLYVAYLQGRNRIALLRRWEMLFALAGIASLVTALMAGGGLLAVVMAQQAWVLLGILRNRWLCRQDAEFVAGRTTACDSAIVAALWPAAWRSGLGVLMTQGLVQLSGLVYAQLGRSTDVSSYLLGLRFMQAINQFSQAPFYSKLPVLARLRAQGRREDLVAVARRGVGLSYFTFMAGFLVVGTAAGPLLELVGSQTRFVSPLMWSLLGLAFLLERIGAMHIQIYTTTNHVIWHTLTGWSGSVMMLLAVLLLPYLGAYAFPVAMVASYAAVYCPISLRHSYRSMGLSVLDFEMRSGALPIAGIGLLWLVIIFFRGGVL